MLRFSLLTTMVIACLAATLLPAAHASTAVGQWFDGNWNCLIDGRPSRMNWRLVDDPQTSCDGDVCTSTSGVTYAGKFSDNGSPWVRLTRISSNANSITMRHADGNTWFLRRQGGTASGWTTWNGSRYPLTCRR